MFTERMRKSVHEGGLYGTDRPAFRRVHYEFIAKTISAMNKTKKGDDRTYKGVTARHFASAFKDAPGFDRARFLRACGLEV